MKTKIIRGEIYLADLAKQIGSEQCGLRPVLVIQNNCGNIHSPTTIICPITSKDKTNSSTHVKISPANSNIKQESVILCEQIRVIDKTRLIRKLGQILDYGIYEELNEKLKMCIGLI